MTELIFSLDTEDFTSNTAADAILEEARIMREEGVRGCFCVVGLLAAQLKNWGRQDVIDELAHHEIGCHSYGHTLHPVLNEYTDIEDFDEAYREVVRQESEALRLLKETFSLDSLCTACPPGNQKNYVAMYAYADMGLPIYADTICDTPNGDGAYYCNTYQIRYTYMLEELMLTGDEEAMRRALDSLAGKHRAVCFTHPNNVLYTKGWDEINYCKYNRAEFGKWEEAPRRPLADSLRFYENFRKFVRMAKADPRFQITTYGEIAKRLRAEAPRTVTRAHIPALRAAIERELYPTSTPLSLSLADMMLACRDLLLGEEAHTCGKVYGFLEDPFAIEVPITLHAADMKESAVQIKKDAFLPTAITVGGVRIGPADWLRAALAVLSGEDNVTITPAAKMPSLRTLPELATASFRGDWMQSDEFLDRYISKRLRLQSWTMRFPTV